MFQAIFVVVIVLVLILAIIGAVISRRAERERREILAGFASELGLGFHPDPDPTHDDTYSHFEVFRRGHSRAAFNTMEGELSVRGRPMHTHAGDFLYKITTSNGKTTTTHTYRFSYVILHLPWEVPDLRIRKEHLGDKIAGALGFDDIDFESSEFSRAFHVTGPDKRFAYDVIDARMIEWLLAERPPAIEVERARIGLTDGRARWSPEQFRDAIRLLDAFLTRWPDHVVASLDSHDAPPSTHE